METRNIIDHYHYWDHEAIMADLDTKRNNFTVICANVENDFNISTVIRNSNAFLANEVWIYGRKQYDRRGTVGTHLYTKFRHVKTIDDISHQIADLKKRNGENIHVVCIDNIPNSHNITNFLWGNGTNAHVVMIFGQEQIGVPKELIEICDDVVYIPQYGSVRSLNVGTASGIAMYDYCSKLVDMAKAF